VSGASRRVWRRPADLPRRADRGSVAAAWSHDGAAALDEHDVALAAVVLAVAFPGGGVDVDRMLGDSGVDATAVATVVPEIIEIRIPRPVVVRMSRWPTAVADEGRMPPLPGGRTQ
jgi:hypothetical protein